MTKSAFYSYLYYFFDLNHKFPRMNVVGVFFLVTGVGLGGSSLVAFSVFCCKGAFGAVRVGFVNDSVLLCLSLDFFLSFCFFIQHSLFIRKGVKEIVSRSLPPKSYGLFFSALSGLVLWTFMLLWQESILIVEFSGVVGMLFRGTFILAVIFLIISYFSLSNVDILGAKVFMKVENTRRKKKVEEKPKISSRGPYGICRHPLYLCWLIFLWSCPRITADRLLMNICWSFWIYFGTLLEEKDLIVEFGEEYKEYKKRVSMLIPYVI